MARGLQLPRALRLHADNASSELKNQHVFRYCAWLLFRNLFSEVSLTTFKVGHSHGRIDQRFSEIRKVLSESPLLQDANDFEEAVRTHVKPRDERDLEVLQIQCAIDWQSFFVPLGVEMSGHTQTKRKTENHEEAIHVFIFQKRSNMDPEHARKIVETFPQEQASPDDVILSCQLYMSSDGDSQPPCVYIPASRWQNLDTDAPKTLCGRKPFSDRQHKELKKTADIVSQRPWQMSRAASYLRGLLAQDVAADDVKPPPMEWALRGTRNELSYVEPASALLPEDLEFHAARRAATVHVSGVALPDRARPPPDPVRSAKRRTEEAPVERRTAAKTKVGKKTAPAVEPDAEEGLPSETEEPILEEAAGSEELPLAASPSLPSDRGASDTAPVPEVEHENPAHDAPNPGMRRPAASKRMARPAAAEAPAVLQRPASRRPHRTQLVPTSALGRLGCGKCRKSAIGCATCSVSIGLVRDEQRPGCWKWP